VTFLGPLTAQPCRLCGRPLRLINRVFLCPDVVHCCHSVPGGNVSRQVQRMREGAR
jgi:hypothetical protein